MGIYALLCRDRFFPTLLKMLALALLALLPLAWWFYAAMQEGGQHFVDLMMEENIGRLMGTMSYESHEQPFYYNFLTILAGMCPWTLAALLAAFAWKRRTKAPLTHAGMFSLTVALVVILFYCIPSSKRSVYLLPAYPFIAYAVASILYSGAAVRQIRIFTVILAFLAIVAPIAVVVMQFNPLPKWPMESLSWWQYLVLAVPFASGVAWFMNRHSPVGHSLVIVWAMLLAYGAAVAPAILNPRSDYKAVHRLIENPQAKVLSLEHKFNYRLFTINYYLHDAVRTVPTLDAAATYPSGTLLLVSEHADTTGLGNNFTFEPLLERSCDHRDRVGLAVRK